ncbi:MAG: hypothetical protein QNK92_12010 [Amylibacter sp.]
MSALTAALTDTLLTTPIVQVTHDRIVKTPRVAEIVIHPGASDIGIDDTALTEFLERAALRYQGTR